ncbi:MAG: insulinase family protein [Candidatus Aminicenantes bacterium]|nr:insulinase family protein [Candidatus Aminicenantes bacterium]
MKDLDTSLRMPTSLKTIFRLGVSFGLLFRSLGPLPAQASLNISVSHYQLPNGLQVILSEDFTLPLVSVAVTYKAGSLHDPPGKAGLAYLLENLMFLGSHNVGQMQHIGYVTRTGGTLNAATMQDRTFFYQTVPSNQLALVLWLESDRMNSLQITPTKVESAKKELTAELRRRHTESPFLKAFFHFDQMLFPDEAGNRPIIGFEENIRAITFEDVAAFHRQHYGPQNAVLSITGNFNALYLRELVSRYFETIPRNGDSRPSPVPPVYEKSSGTETVPAAGVPSPAVFLGFRFPSVRQDDEYGLALIDYLLCRGNTSRLVQKAVKRERLANQLSGSLEKRSGLTAYRIFATNNNAALARQCADAVHGELARLRSYFVSEEELNRAKNLWRKDRLDRLSSLAERALYLSEQLLDSGQPRNPSVEMSRVMDVTPLEIAGLMNRYFTRDNCLVLYILK